MKKPLLFVLIIYVSFSTQLMCQNLNLIIRGHNTEETDLIDSLDYYKSHKDYASIAQEIDTLKTKLYTMGFLDAKWQKTEKINDSTFQASVTLNKPFKTINILFDNNILPPRLKAELRIKNSDSIFSVPFQNIETTLDYINLKISEKGFPFNTVKLADIIKTDLQTLQATLVVSETSSVRYVDKILVKGYKRFPKSYLKHYMKLRTGNPIDISEIKQQTRLLDELPFANQIKEPEILFSKDSTILYVYIEKNKSNTFDGFIGFGTNEESGKLELNGYLNLDLINNLNFGESLSLIYKSDESEQKTFNVNIKTPYLFNTPLGAELELNIFKRDSSFTTVDQSARLSYQLNSKNQFSFGIKSTKSNNLLSTENTDPSIQDYETSFYTVRYQFNKRQINSRLFRRSASISIETGLGKRDLQNQASSQTQYNLNAFKIFNLNPKNSIYLRVNSFGLFSDTYLENELARFGGINSIRGFEENSLKANFYGLLNTEYRYLLSSNLYIHSIIDIAYLENDLNQQKDKLYGFGFGFGLLTKAGLLRFNYANGKTENQTFKFANSQIHLSLSAVF